MQIEFKLNKRLGNRECAYRVVRRFAFLPIRVTDTKLVWLEWVYIIQQYNYRAELWCDIDSWDSYNNKLFTSRKGYKRYKTYLKLNWHYPEYINLCRGPEYSIPGTEKNL